MPHQQRKQNLRLTPEPQQVHKRIQDGDVEEEEIQMSMVDTVVVEIILDKEELATCRLL